MDLTYPTTVNSSDRYCYNDDWEFPDTQIINFEFGDDKLVTWEGRSCNGRSIEDSSAGASFYGEKGTLVIGGGNAYKIYDLQNKIIKDIASNLEFKPGDLTNPAEQLDAFHFSNFLKAIKENTPLNADINTGCISSTLAQLGNISQRTKKTLIIDPDNGHILNDKDALKLWSRTYEKGWEMKP